MYSCWLQKCKFLKSIDQPFGSAALQSVHTVQLYTILCRKCSTRVHTLLQTMLQSPSHCSIATKKQIFYILTSHRKLNELCRNISFAIKIRASSAQTKEKLLNYFGIQPKYFQFCAQLTDKLIAFEVFVYLNLNMNNLSTISLMFYSFEQSLPNHSMIALKGTNHLSTISM